ncbi:MAG: universal stress protein [Chloroflexi bacterium]|nr:universal stress protein [Chloroflexota bacterium]
MFGNILLAVDGSEHALHTAKMAGELARTMKAETVRVVVVYNNIPSYLGEPNMQTILDKRLHDANIILEAALKALGEIPGEIHTELIEGTPAEAVIEIATIRKADVIVMGSRGMSSLAGLLLGSTSQKVVAHAPCPVLVMR